MAARIRVGRCHQRKCDVNEAYEVKGKIPGKEGGQEGRHRGMGGGGGGQSEGRGGRVLSHKNLNPFN